MRLGSARVSGSGSTAMRATDAEGSVRAHTGNPAAPSNGAAGLLVLGDEALGEGPTQSNYFETALNAFTWPWPLNEL